MSVRAPEFYITNRHSVKAAIHSDVLKVTHEIPITEYSFYAQIGNIIQLFGKSQPGTRLGCKEVNLIGWYYVAMNFDI